MEIVNYKAWTYKSYQKAYNVRYVNIVNKLEKGATTLRTSIGFAPLLIRFLRMKGFDASGEEFRAREATFPAMQLSLYDFQERMVADWLRAGGIGVIKAPTGSGKCPRWDTLVLTNRGFVKIEDIVKKKEQTSIEDFFRDDKTEDDENDIKNVISLKNSILGYKPFKIINKYDIGTEELITVKTSLGLKISGTKEHPIVVIGNNGKLIFKKLQDISKEDYIAISYNTQVFNEELKLKYHYRSSTAPTWKLDNIKYMNEEIARILGYVIAEGNAAFSGDKGVYIVITNYDKEIIDDITNICKNLGIEVTYRYEEGKNDNNPIGAIISSVMFVDFIYYLGYKYLAQNKEVPWSILQANKKCQIGFLKALFDGDGTVYRGEDKDIVEYYSSSYEMCRQVQLMLLNMGIMARLDTKKGATNEYKGELRTYEESYRLTMYGVDVLKFADIVSFGLTRKREILNKCVEAIKNRGKWSNIVYPHLDITFKILHERLKEICKKGFQKDGKIFSSSYDYLKYNSFHKEIWSYINGERLPSRSTLEKILYIFSPIKDVNKLYNDVLTDHGMNIRIDKYVQTYDYIQSLYNNFIFDKVEDIKEEKDRVYDITIDNVHSYIGNGIINHNTIIGGKAIEEIGRKTLILVHTSDLLVNVWIDSLIKSFGPGITYQVGIVGGGVTDKDRVTMRIGTRTSNFGENMRKDIVIATFQTLINHLDELCDYKFGLMIVDEVHHAPSKMFRKVNTVIKAPYKLGLSATMTRLDGMEKDIFGQMGDVQSKVSIRELINKGILAEPRFQSPVIVDQEVMAAIETCGLGGLNLSRFVKKASASSQKKLDYIINICKNIAARGRTFLLFTDYVRAEDVFVRDMYAERLIQEGLSISIVDQGMSSDERSKVFNYLETGKISGIIFGKLGSEGVNIPSVNVIIMANGIKSPITFCQRVGRGMRKVEGKDWCDVYEVLIDIPMEHRWSDFNFAEYRAEGFQKTVYKVE